MAKNNRSGLGRGLNSLLGEPMVEEKPVVATKPVIETPKPVSNPVPVVNVSRETSMEEQAEKAPVIERQPIQKPIKIENVSKSESEDVRGDNIEIKGIVSREAVKAAPKPSQEPVKEEKPSKYALQELPLNWIEPNPDQPRTQFKKEDLKELASSIEKDGLLQPILVRKVAEEKYQIIAGERRWQACGLAKVETVPVHIVGVDDDTALELALIENIQRSDLNPIEEAYGYKRLMERRNMTQAEVAQAMSKGRSTIANALRLLELPEDAQQLLFEGKITAGHARAILSIPTLEGKIKLTNKLIEEKLSVREAESIARLFSMKKGEGESAPRVPKPKSFKTAEKILRKNLNTAVRVKTVKGKNKIEIEFADEEQLQKIIEGITASEQE